MEAIRLLEGLEKLTKREYSRFQKGDTIWGPDSDAKEIKRWPISEKEDAQMELKNYYCEYDIGSNEVNISEYALEYFEEDEDGEFLRGSDFDLAEER